MIISTPSLITFELEKNVYYQQVGQDGYAIVRQELEPFLTELKYQPFVIDAMTKKSREPRSFLELFFTFKNPWSEPQSDLKEKSNQACES